MILRALLSGNVVLFEEALAELSGVSIDRVTAYIHDKNISGFRALYREAGLPDLAYPAFREAIAAMREGVVDRRAGRGGAAQAAHGRARARRLRAMSAAKMPRRCWPCCGVLRSKLRARKRVCSATIWSRETPVLFRPIQSYARTPAAGSGRKLDFSAGVYSGTIDGPLSCSSTSGRSRFSWIRNSSVTSRKRFVSVAASSLASERAYSR